MRGLWQYPRLLIAYNGQQYVQLRLLTTKLNKYDKFRVTSRNRCLVEF